MLKGKGKLMKNKKCPQNLNLEVVSFLAMLVMQE
jgi:hypothetical protein